MQTEINIISTKDVLDVDEEDMYYQEWLLERFAQSQVDEYYWNQLMESYYN